MSCHHEYLPKSWQGKTFDKKNSQLLKLKWKWIPVNGLSRCDPNDNRRLPCQVSYAELKNGIRLKVIEWSERGAVNGHNYEVQIINYGEEILSEGEERFDTRVEAELAAEESLRKLVRRFMKLVKEYGL